MKKRTPAAIQSERIANAIMAARIRRENVKVYKDKREQADLILRMKAAEKLRNMRNEYNNYLEAHQRLPTALQSHSAATLRNLHGRLNKAQSIFRAQPVIAPLP